MSMRDILFKAKTTAKEKREFNNVWIQGDLITPNGKYYIHPKSNSVNVKNELGKIIVMHEVIPDTICQYTGLVDKKGNKIWENDVIQYIDKDLVVNGVVRFGRHEQIVMHELGFYVDWVSEGTECFKTDICYWVEKRNIEVIGNIFDNSELLIESEER